MASTALRYQESHTLCSGDGMFGLLSRAADKQFIATRMSHVTRKTKKKFHATPHAIISPKIKQGWRNTSDKKEVRAEQKLIKPISLVITLALNNSSARCVLTLCKTNYLITFIARLVMSDMEQLIGWWRKLHENRLWILTVTEHLVDDPIKWVDISLCHALHRREMSRVLVGKAKRKGHIIIRSCRCLCSTGMKLKGVHWGRVTVTGTGGGFCEDGDWTAGSRNRGIYWQAEKLRYFRPPPWSRWELCSFGLIQSK